MTLIELLIALAITTILFGVVLLMFRTSLESFFISQRSLYLQKVLDEILTDIIDGGAESYGIIDAVEFKDLSDTTLSFIPLWVDAPKNSADNKRFILTKAFSEGGPLPFVEIKTSNSEKFVPMPVTFYSNNNIIEFDSALPSGSKIKAIYLPGSDDSEVIFNLKWDTKNKSLIAQYRKRERKIPKYSSEGVSISEVRFEYFDNTNKLIEPNSKTHKLDSSLFPLVSAVKVLAKVASKGEVREGFVFVNLRNKRSAGAGIKISEGTQIKIPDSYNIRTFSIANISPVTKPGVIEIETRPKTGDIWKITLKLNIKNDKPLIEQYLIEYPKGQVIYTENINMTTDLALNLLSLGTSGRYDYDFDGGAQDAVLLKGDVEFFVTKMDFSGASLYLRP